MTPDLLDITIALVIYFILIFQYKKLNKTLFLNPVSPILLVFAISISTVNYFYRTGDMNDREYYILMLEFMIYFIFIFIAPFFVKTKYINLSNYMNISKFDIQITKIIFYISLIIGLFYIFLLWANYGSGDERFILNRQQHQQRTRHVGLQSLASHHAPSATPISGVRKETPPAVTPGNGAAARTTAKSWQTTPAPTETAGWPAAAGWASPWSAPWPRR